jgi:hypothetical protein
MKGTTMTTTATPLETVAPSATVELPDGGHVAIVNYGDRIGLHARNEEYAAFVFLTSEQAGAVAQLLLLASTEG